MVLLRGSSPTVWRRLEVPSWLSLDELHHCLRLAFDWDESGSFLFRAGTRRFAGPGCVAVAGESRIENAVSTPLAAVGIEKLGPIEYVFDLAAFHVHDISLELAWELGDGSEIPRCTGGAQAVGPRGFDSDQVDEALQARFGRRA